MDIRSAGAGLHKRSSSGGGIYKGAVTRMTEPCEPLRLVDRLALRPREAAAALGVSERTFRSMLPRIPHYRECGAVLIPVDVLREWLRERATTRQSQLEALEREFSDRIAESAD